MRYRLAIFDFDGVLADSAPWFVDALAGLSRRHRFRLPDEAELQALRRLGSREIVQRLEVPAWRLPLIAVDLRRRMDAEIDRIGLFDGAGEMLRAVAGSGVVCAIVSSNAETNVRRVLGDHAGAVAILSCGAGLFGKAARFKATIRRAGVTPAETLCIGDEQRDVEAARAAGAAAGVVNWGYADPEFLRRCDPDMVFETPAEIARRLVA